MKTSRFISLLLSVFLLLSSTLLFSSCNGDIKSYIVGTWYERTENGTINKDIGLKFYDDDTVYFVVDGQNTNEGTYQIKGDKIIIKYASNLTVEFTYSHLFNKPVILFDKSLLVKSY